MADSLRRDRFRVYYEDTDAGGVVYHTAYLRFAERGRTEFLRDLGIEQDKLRREQGLGFVVARMEIDFIAPAYLDDVVEVTTRVKRGGRAGLLLAQELLRHARPLVRMIVRIACIDATGRPTRLPAPLDGLAAPVTKVA